MQCLSKRYLQNMGETLYVYIWRRYNHRWKTRFWNNLLYSSYVIKCLVSELSLILITIKPLIYNVPGLKCHLIIPPTLVLVDHFSYLTRNILTYTVQIHAIVNPHHTKKLSINYAYLYLYVGTYADLGVEIQKHAL